VDTWVKTVCQYREVLPIIGFAIKDGKFNGFYLGKRVAAANLASQQNQGATVDPSQL
jgi:hypothetical protein